MTLASAVIPTYGDSNTLGNAIRSALSQTVDVEVVVVDDASPDDTQHVVESIDSPKVTLYEHDKNRGGSAARNTGVQAASTPYIGFLDADDEWRPRKVERQIDLLESRSDEWVAVYCGWEDRRAGAVTQILNDVFPRPTGIEGDEEVFNALLHRRLSLGPSSTFLVKAAAIDAIGGWDERFQRLQDIEFILRLVCYGKIGYVDAPLVIKNETAAPAIETVETAYELFREKFQSELESAPEAKRIWDFMLAKHRFGSGKMLDGLQSLWRSKCPHRRDALGLSLAIATGAIRKIGGRS